MSCLGVLFSLDKATVDKLKDPSIISLILLTSCVPIQQQVADAENERLSRYELQKLVISSDEFFRVLNPGSICDESSLTKGLLTSAEERMKENFQSSYSINEYGEIYAGQVTRLYDRQKADAIQVLHDYLLLTINYGGGAEKTPLVECKFIWSGEYYRTPQGLTVDIVLSFKDLDFHRANIHKSLRLDLTPLKRSDSEVIYINLLGYNKLIKYQK